MRWLFAALALAGCARVVPPEASPRAQRLALKAQGRAAFEAKQYAKCAESYAKAGDAYNAACCHALAGELDLAFAQLRLEAKRGVIPVATYEKDADLALAHADTRWGAVLREVEAGVAARKASLNAELQELYEADQADRRGTVDWAVVRPRDEAREKRVNELLAAGGAKVAADFFAAAMVFQHGGDAAHAARAHELALKAVALDPDFVGARWLAAAALDRKLMHEGQPQKYGTQFRKLDDGKWFLWQVDPAVTDAERAEWAVPPLSEAQARVDRMNAAPP